MSPILVLLILPNLVKELFGKAKLLRFASAAAISD